MSAPPVLTELKLSEDMKKAVNTAFERRKPIVISYVDENNAPKLSFRGSTQAYGDTALAIWVRMPDGPILAGVKRNPAVALIYGDFREDGRDFMIFRGRARIDTSDDARYNREVDALAGEARRGFVVPASHRPEADAHSRA